jgi:hypothetical protein
VGREAPGIECACARITFEREPIRDDDTMEWERLLGVHLFRVGSTSSGAELIYVASDGRVFGRSELHDAFYLYGLTFGGACDALLFGKRARPLLRPGQAYATLYGQVFTSLHPHVYEYHKPA